MQCILSITSMRVGSQYGSLHSSDQQTPDSLKIWSLSVVVSAFCHLSAYSRNLPTSRRFQVSTSTLYIFLRPFWSQTVQKKCDPTPAAPEIFLAAGRSLIEMTIATSAIRPSSGDNAV